MKNNTKLRVPKKYEHMIDEIIFEEGSGYFVYLAEGFYTSSTGCHTICERTQKDALAEIRQIKPELYNVEEADGLCYEVDLTFEQAVERYKTLNIEGGQKMFSKHTGDNVEKIWDFKCLKRNESFVINNMVKVARDILAGDSVTITHDAPLEFLCVEFSHDGSEYVFEYDNYRELYKEYEESCLYNYVWFEEYIAYVSRSW